MRYDILYLLVALTISVILNITLTGCGKNDPRFVSQSLGPQGPQGDPGKPGSRGPKGEEGLRGSNSLAPNLSIVSAPVEGECYRLGVGLWLKNEGRHADVYNNDLCHHGPAPRAVLCNNLAEGDSRGDREVCWIGRRQFFLKGRDSSLKLYEITWPR